MIIRGGGATGAGGLAGDVLCICVTLLGDEDCAGLWAWAGGAEIPAGAIGTVARGGGTAIAGGALADGGGVATGGVAGTFGGITTTDGGR
jgi:hypothetical protein